MKSIFLMLSAFMIYSCARRDTIGLNEYAVVEHGVPLSRFVKYLEKAKNELKHSNLTAKGIDLKRQPRMTIIGGEKPIIQIALPTQDGISGSETWVIVSFSSEKERALRVTQMCVTKR